jgi:hypothetical protein
MAQSRPGPSTPLERILRITRVARTVSPAATPANDRNMDDALPAAAAMLRRGEVVCLAGEGMFNLLNEDSPARARLEEFLGLARFPVVVVRVTGAMHGVLLARDGRLTWNPRGRWHCRVAAHFGVPEAI